MSEVSPANDLHSAVRSVPAGKWAIGVSGGADSVALLELLRQRRELQLHVVHLDHETRGTESTADADFVRALAERHGLPATIARRGEIEESIATLENNPSARYRAARLALFRRVVLEHSLGGVILAHHADDQAETIMQRLFRGASRSGLTGMSPRTCIGGLLVLRPMLSVDRDAMRATLAGQSWREDASNQSSQQQRNRVRAMLTNHAQLKPVLVQLAFACAAVGEWLVQVTPLLDASFAATVLQSLSPPLAREAAKQWLTRRGGADIEIPHPAVQRLIEMANDAATPSRQDFPGNLHIRRRGGIIEVVK